METNKTNIDKLMLFEFCQLSRSDIEIQISKNFDALRDINNKTETEKTVKGEEIDNMIQKFYLSLSNYFSKNTGSDCTYDNSNYTTVKSFKKNYMKFLKV